MKRLLTLVALFATVSASAYEPGVLMPSMRTGGGVQSAASKQAAHCYKNHLNYQAVKGQKGYCFKPGRMGSFSVKSSSSNLIGGSNGEQSAASVRRSCHKNHLNYMPVHGEQGYCYKSGLMGSSLRPGQNGGGVRRPVLQANSYVGGVY